MAVLCRSWLQRVLVKSDANDWSGRTQMGGRVSAITQVSERLLDLGVYSCSPLLVLAKRAVADLPADNVFARRDGPYSLVRRKLAIPFHFKRYGPLIGGQNSRNGLVAQVKPCS